MEKIAIVTDSSSDIPPDLAEKYDIKIIPMYINFDGKTYKEGKDITVNKVFNALDAGLKVKTSCPSTGDFAELFKKLFNDNYDKIYYIGIGSKLSSSINSASIAKAYFPENKIVIIDSKNTTISLGLLVLEFAKLLNKNINENKLKQHLDFLIKNYSFFAAIDNFEYILRSGRTPFLAKFISKVMIFKPIVSINNKGKICLRKFVKNNINATIELYKQTKNKIDSSFKWNIGIFYGLDPKPAKELDSIFKKDKKININKVILTKITTVISAHTGPGVWGVAFGPSID